MPWIESHTALARHPKTLKLGRALNISVPAAIGHLHLLWWWALEYAPEGDLSRFEPDDIAIACVWDGDSGALLDGLRTAGFLDAGDLLHDWFDYAGRLVERRREAVERTQRWRETHKPAEHPVTRNERARYAAHVDRKPDVTYNVPVTYAYVTPHSTEQDPTEQDHTQPDHGGGGVRGEGREREEEGEGEAASVAVQPDAVPIPAPTPPSLSTDALDEMHGILSRFHDRGYVVDRKFYAKVSELYPRLDVVLEAMKLTDWLREPRHKGERCTVRRVFNWLAKAEEDRVRKLAERDQAKLLAVNLNGPTVQAKPYTPTPPPELPPLTPEQEKASDAERERVRAELAKRGVLHKYAAIGHVPGGPAP